MFKKICNTNFELFLFHIFLLCEKSILQVFILLYTNVKAEPIANSWNFEVGS